MSIELIATLTPSGSSTATFSSIPTTYKRLKIIGTVSPTSISGNPGLSFGTNNGSDYIYSNVNYAASGGKGQSSTGAYGLMPLLYGGFDTASNTTTQARPIVINIPRFGYSSPRGVEFTLLTANTSINTYQGTLEYHGGTNQNASSIGFTQITFSLSASTFSSDTVFSLYGYL